LGRPAPTGRLVFFLAARVCSLLPSILCVALDPRVNTAQIDQTMRAAARIVISGDSDGFDVSGFYQAVKKRSAQATVCYCLLRMRPTWLNRAAVNR